MTIPNLSFNPMQTTTAAGLFYVKSDGIYQGVALDDPAARFALAGGVLATTENYPMWGGVGVYTTIPGSVATLASELGTTIGRATTISAVGATGALAGFSVFNQANAWITTPQNPVPIGLGYMTVPYYPLGSGARIGVQCDTALAAALLGGQTSTQVSWDFTNQQLAPYNAAWNANVITAATWAATSGGQVTFTTTTAHGVAVGADFTISGMTPSGYNGDFKAITGTTGSTLVAALTTNPGASTVQGTLVAGGGALPVKILRINQGNSKTVTWDPVNLVATWNNSGTAAIIQI